MIAAPTQCVWKINDHVSLFAEEVEADQFRLSTEHRDSTGQLDSLVSTVVSRGQLQAFARLLHNFLADE